jgi:CBS domain-containing protein
MKTIGQLVERRETVVAERHMPIVQVARLMSSSLIGAVPVLDGDRVAGIFTERDVLTRVVAAEVDPAKTPVGDVMSTELVVASADESVDACKRRMQQACVRHMLVLREGRLAGIVSLRDLLAVEIDEKDEAINLLNAYVPYIPVDLTTTKQRV